MKDTPKAWQSQVRTALANRGVDRMLAKGPAIAVERFARGGGNTAWYRLERPDDLDVLAALLRPGSDLRIAFGDAFTEGEFDAAMASLVHRIAAEEREAVILARGQGFELEHDFPSSAAEATEFVAASSPTRHVWVGRFPGRTDDGVLGVRLDLPDLDGKVRGHPH